MFSGVNWIRDQRDFIKWIIALRWLLIIALVMSGSALPYWTRSSLTLTGVCWSLSSCGGPIGCLTRSQRRHLQRPGVIYSVPALMDNLHIFKKQFSRLKKKKKFPQWIYCMFSSKTCLQFMSELSFESVLFKNRSVGLNYLKVNLSLFVYLLIYSFY